MAVNVVMPDYGDVVLQGEMDGIDAAKIIRESYDIPCVFLTAYSDPSVLTRAKACEPAGYIVKPFEPESFRQVVVDLLARSRDAD